MATILEEIIAHKHLEVAEQKKKITEDELICMIENSQDSSRGFMKALRHKAILKQPAVIAEIKKASPSLGVIREDFDPVSIAKSYQQGGATCLSVLTDRKYFQGDNDYIRKVRHTVSLPVLRKDFIVDPYQVIESRVLGADAILLIVAVLNDRELLELTYLAHDLGMDVLAEVHNADECQRALQLPIRVIGVNNRNLHDFSVDLDTSQNLKMMLPNNDYLLISESGINTAEDIQRLQKADIHAFLIGGSLMKAPNPGAALAQLLR